MRVRILVLAICALAVSLMSVNARADVIYSFSGNNSGTPVSFTLTSSDFLTNLPGTILFHSQFSSCTNCTNLPIVAVLAPNAFFGSSLLLTDLWGGTGLYMFTQGAFGAAGVYKSGGLFSSGVLTVSVPEPAQLMFAFMGLAMLLGFVALGRKSGMHMVRS